MPSTSPTLLLIVLALLTVLAWAAALLELLVRRARLRKLARERSISVWLITHDLHAVRGASDEVTVMYAGRVVEQGPTEQVLNSPRHPFTAALLAANPAATKPSEPLPTLGGSVPLASEVIAGCRFHPRCSRVIDRCRTERPPFSNGVACHLASSCNSAPHPDPLPAGVGRGG